MNLLFKSRLSFLLWLLIPSLTCFAPSRAAQGGEEIREAAAFARAEKAERVGNYQAAENIYQQVLREHPGEMAAELNLGLTYYMDRNYGDSVSHLMKALQAKPDLFPALMVGGVDFIKMGNPQRAVPLLRRGRALRPADEYVNHNLASAEYLAGDYVRACADYVRDLKLPGRDRDEFAWYGLGEVSLLLGRHASAQLGKLSRANPYRLRLLATFYGERQEWGLALARLKQLKAEQGWREWVDLQMGEIALRRSKFTEAAEEFREVLSAKPQSAQAHFGLGISLLYQGKTAAALRELGAAAGDPWLFAHTELGGAASSLPAAAPALSPQHARAVNSSSALAVAFVALAEHRQRSDSTESAAAFHRALKVAIAQARQKNGKRLRETLEGTGSPQVILKLASGFQDEGDFETASDALEHLRDESESLAILEARSKAAQDDPLGSVEFLLPLLQDEKSPLSPQTNESISDLLQSNADLALGRVLAVAPNGADAHLLKAQIDDAASKTEAAIQEYRLAVNAAPDNPETYFKLGEALWRAAHFRQAILVLGEGLKLDPHDAPAYYQLGDSYRSLGQPSAALPFLVKALEQDPTLITASTDLATIELNQGKIRQAAAALQKIAPSDQDGSVHYLLFRAYSKLGDLSAAAAALKRFQELKTASQNQTLFNAELAGNHGASETRREN
jgi:tetratricopeptide (TPR) repeat protein